MSTRSQRRPDDGFSLVEVIIAMFLLAIISLAVLPLIVTGVQVSVFNRDVTTATAFANAQLAPLKAEFPTSPTAPTSCSDLEARIATAVADQDNLSAVRTMSPCPPATEDYPASVPVTVTVSDSGGELARVVSRIPVSGR